MDLESVLGSVKGLIKRGGSVMLLPFLNLFMSSEVVDHEAVTRRDIPAMPELNDLQTAWNEQGRHYEEKSGEIEVGGQRYQFRVSFVDLDSVDLETFPTNRRVVTEVGVDLRTRPDFAVCVLPGWGETSAQFEGDFLELLLEELKLCGYKNPRVVGVSVSGRGTPEYLAEGNRNRISRIGMMDEVDDARKLVSVLNERGYFGQGSVSTPVAIIGHSMGALNAMEALDRFNAVSLFTSRRRRVDKVLNMMPVVDGPLALLRTRFLSAVRKQVLPSIGQAWIKRSGSLDLNQADYNRIMFGDVQFRDPEQRARSVPDSALRFLQATLNTRERFGYILRPNGTADNVDFTVLRGGKDRLIPDNAVSYLPDLVKRRGLKGRAEVVDLPDLSHSIPFRLRGEQREQVQAALKGFLKK